MIGSTTSIFSDGWFDTQDTIEIFTDGWWAVVGVVVVAGPGLWKVGQIYLPGLQQAQVFCQ